jgi:hypothetical protein
MAAPEKGVRHQYEHPTAEADDLVEALTQTRSRNREKSLIDSGQLKASDAKVLEAWWY